LLQPGVELENCGFPVAAAFVIPDERERSQAGPRNGRRE
jgi:hypothetical protein